MYIKPVAGRQVPDPDHGGVLPESGRHVKPHQYWLRRLGDGDVIESDPPKESVAAAVKQE
jgi:hypothetical protein